MHVRAATGGEPARLKDRSATASALPAWGCCANHGAVRVLVLLLAGFSLAVLSFNLFVYILRARVVRRLPDCDAVDTLGWIDAAACFLEECLATAFARLAPPRRRRVSDPPVTTAATARGPLVLVHDWSVSSGSFAILRRRLLRDGFGPLHEFRYRSARADVEAIAGQLRDLIEPLAAQSNQPITLIGHGIGGLVVRYYARRFPARRVRRLLTLGAPHRGTLLARRWLAHLAPESTWINRLNAGDRSAQQYDAIAISSTFDALLLPPAAAYYEGALNIQLNNVGHYALLTSRRVYELIAENLAAPLR